jgi:hypothetical protein
MVITYLLGTKSKRQNNENYQGSIPKWFLKLETEYTLSHFRRLITPINQDNDHRDSTSNSPPIRKNALTYPKSQWTIHWNNNIKQAIMGKTLAQDSTDSPSLTYMEHYIEHPHNQNNNLTPHKRHLVLTKCNGCPLNSYYPFGLRPSCVITIPTKRTTIFKIYKNLIMNIKNIKTFSTKEFFMQ